MIPPSCISLNYLSTIGGSLQGYVKVPPNKALVVFGRRHQDGNGVRILTEGGTFVTPIIESSKWLDLSPTTLNLTILEVVTKDLKLVNLECLAQVQIDPSENGLRIAAVMLLGKTPDEVEYIAKKTLEGAVRGGCTTLRLSEINADQMKIAEQIGFMSMEDLMKMGIAVVSFVIRDIRMDSGIPEGSTNTLQANLLMEQVERLQDEVKRLKKCVEEKNQSVPKPMDATDVEPPPPGPDDEPHIPLPDPSVGE